MADMEVPQQETAPEMPKGFLDPGLPKGYLSVSQIFSWQSCGEAYRRRYVENDQRRSNTASKFRGSVVHSLAELMLKTHASAGEIPALAVVLDRANEVFDQLKGDVENWENTPEDFSRVIVRQQLTALHAGLQKLPRPVSIETPFSKKVGDVPMVGRIDRIDELETADLKTGKKWSQAEVDGDLQLSLYAIITGHELVRIDMLTTAKTPEFVQLRSRRTYDDKMWATELVQERAKMIKLGVFPKADPTSWKCTEKWCEYYKECRGKQRQPAKP